MSGPVRGSLEEALSAALLEWALPGGPNAVEELVGAVADWLDTVAPDEGIKDLTRAVKTEDGVPLRPYWSGRTLAGLAAMLRRRL